MFLRVGANRALVDERPVRNRRAVRGDSGCSDKRPGTAVRVPPVSSLLKPTRPAVVVVASAKFENLGRSADRLALMAIDTRDVVKNRPKTIRRWGFDFLELVRGSLHHFLRHGAIRQAIVSGRRFRHLLSRNGETYHQKTKHCCNCQIRYKAFHDITLTDVKNGPCSARSDSHSVLSLGCLGLGFQSAPIPKRSLRCGAQCVEAYAARQVVAIDLRYK